MATKQTTAEFFADQMSGAGDVSIRKMFGEYAVYFDGKVVALICDEKLFVKPTVAGKAFLGNTEEAPPYPGAKMYFLIDADKCEDRAFLSELIQRTATELPTPKKRLKVRKKP